MLSRTLVAGFKHKPQFAYNTSGEEGELIVGRLYWESVFTDKIALGDTLPESISSSIFTSSRSYLGQKIWLIRG